MTFPRPLLLLLLAPALAVAAPSLFLAPASTPFQASFLDSAKRRILEDTSKHYKHGKCSNLELLAAFLGEQGISRTKADLVRGVNAVAAKTDVFLGKESEQLRWGIGAKDRPVASDGVALFSGGPDRALAEKNCKCKVGAATSHAVIVWSSNGTESYPALPTRRAGHVVSTHELMHLVFRQEGVTSVDLHHSYLRYMGWGNDGLRWQPSAGACAIGGSASLEDGEPAALEPGVEAIECEELQEVPEDAEDEVPEEPVDLVLDPEP